MKRRLLFLFAFILGNMLLLSSCKRDYYTPECKGDATVTTSKVFATGFNNPRGLKFGPDGYLYVAEGGTGGNHFSTGCQQAPAPVGPYMGNDSTSRISRVDWQGARSTFVNYLPSCTAGAKTGSGVTGMADVAFIGNTLYGLIAGGGCSHGVPDVPNGLIKSKGGGSWTLAANYSQFILAHPGVNYDPADYTPDGNPWSMINVNNKFYIVEANSGVLDEISPNGNIKRVVDISATQGHIVPTALAWHKGYFFVGNLGTFPIMGKSNVYMISPSGQIKVLATGFSTILGLAFDNHDRLYILENTVGAPGPTPGLGNVVRLDLDGSKHVVVSGLNLPTAMTFGPDGKLYISNNGIGAPGTGEVLQVTFTCESVWPDKNASVQ
ncbi:MAG: ScyD/ScyE family protein [Ginsengibacter sp.]